MGNRLGIYVLISRGHVCCLPAWVSVIGHNDFLGSSNGAFGKPKHLAYDSTNVKFFVSTDQSVVYRFNLTEWHRIGGQPEMVFGSGGFSCNHSSFDTPTGLAVDEESRLYVADFQHNRVLYFDSAGVTEGTDFDPNDNNMSRCEATTLEQPYPVEFASPFALAIDGNRSLWVSTQSTDRRLFRFRTEFYFFGSAWRNYGPWHDARSRVRYVVSCRLIRMFEKRGWPRTKGEILVLALKKKPKKIFDYQKKQNGKTNSSHNKKNWP
eukprot:TRINITY_DN192_c0_g2_i3.p1 TRINITY_DN192_c0_g2~~TRINITY_DN192_c0_g2_i3.p1  ORF type:complete len:265 (-),score=12.83 TRINITY_DN192_c0_g2_i3:321-1115(-)